jgi:hypothetical protein
MAQLDAILFDLDGVITRTGRAFALGVGIDRDNRAEALKLHGVDVVVNDLSVLAIDDDLSIWEAMISPATLWRHGGNDKGANHDIYSGHPYEWGTGSD